MLPERSSLRLTVLQRLRSYFPLHKVLEICDCVCSQHIQQRFASWKASKTTYISHYWKFRLALRGESVCNALKHCVLKAVLSSQLIKYFSIQDSLHEAPLEALRGLYQRASI
jgi:hypothetical protein